jgi:predicted nucleotidyltransferase
VNEASRWRMALAERVGAAYAQNPNAQVVMVAGSVGRGTADRYSDLELDVYYAEPPTVSERVAAVEAAGGTLEGLAEDEVEWEEQMSFDGFRVHTSTFLVATMERFLRDVLEEFSTALEPQTRLFSVLNGVALEGGEQVERWRNRAAAYPDELRRAMLEANLDFSDFRYAAAMHAARDDRLVLHELLLETSRRLLGALFGLNRIYFPTFDYVKRVDEWIALLELEPPELSGRLKRAFAGDAAGGVAGLDALIAETLALVDRHVPGFDTTPYRACGKRRTEWSHAPDVAR